MEWENISFDWNRARAFLVTAEEGSFSAAARALGTTQPTIGRQITALEEELGVMLFERGGRQPTLTAAGLDLLEHARGMSEAAARLSLVAAGRSVALEGLVRVTAGEAISAYILPPIVAQIRARYPAIEVELLATNTPSDLVAREADIGLRNFRPTQPGLIAKKLGEGFARLYATPAYLESLGNPTTPEGLSKAQFIGFDRGPAFMDGLNQMGLKLTRDNFRLITANQLVQWELAKKGAGVCVMMEDIGDAEPSVRRALPDLPPFPVPRWLTCHQELQTSRRVRVVFDILAKELGG